MIQVITDGNRIRKLHSVFQNQLAKFMDKRIHCWVGYPSGSFEDRVQYSTELNIWLSKFDHENRFWNGFGIGKPKDGKNNSLNGEINFPYEGINRKIAGVFAIENNKNILVLHRGKIGGGRKGVGKVSFLNKYSGDKVTAIDGDRESLFCLVGELNSDYLPIQVAFFINEIYHAKTNKIIELKPAFNSLSDFSYTDESSGISVTENSEPKRINRIHGIVVKALSNELQKRNFLVGNDKNRDLYIHDGYTISTLFEVKTNSSTQSLYSMIGQLLLYSIPIKNKVKLVAVIPNSLSEPVIAKLQTIGIIPLYYQWIKDKPVFKDLDLTLQINY